MVSLFGHSTYHFDVLTAWFCLLAVSQAYVNVALRKPAYIQDQYDNNKIFAASNAVDGRKSVLVYHGGQCAASDWGQTATWWVNLTSIHSIHHITIYFSILNRNDFINVASKFFLGFSVYISNTTDRSQGTLCFKDNNFTQENFPPVFTTTCSVHGQYVIYFNERIPGASYPDSYHAFVVSNLCEVEVYGCPGGFYGTNCSIACPDTNCYCHLETGTCRGCKHGYHGYLCKLACNSGSYGLGCSESCGQCLDVDKCLNTNGTCLTGCSAGYRGHTCDKPCQYGFFGPDCGNRCNDTCDGCNRFNGSCDSGCNLGWQGYDCQKACDKGSFGGNCSETCGNCRDVDQCSNINGKCLTGCDAGYQGELCKTYCDKGTFGMYCKEKCGHCRDNKQCFHTNGTCLTGCIAGFQGHQCKTSCNRGFFGENCAYECADTCNDCNDVTGLCEYGCIPGWTGYVCHKACTYGLFGRDCTEQCNDTCTGCNNVNGVCDRGCYPGWMGDYCEIGNDRVKSSMVFFRRVFKA
ncbi:multiple epidermal growth factor-like domains protein 10 [Magallana gigas]|uniref:multiple epidermal growth factor-like domains protein 10 n=1 Tax=Magallana gigas TaxID=29159 RepID=UPI003340C08D